MLDEYNEAKNLRISKDYEKCLLLLSNIKKDTLEASYDIAEIYLNEYSNYSIALDYFNSIIDSLGNKEAIDENNLNLYKKSLFMSSYIYSNYLAMYSRGANGYKAFLLKFPDDELSESVQYELSLLKPFEETKEKLLENVK